MSRKSNSIFFAQMLSFYETLNRGSQRQEQKQPLNTLASNVLFIYKTKKPRSCRKKGRRPWSYGNWLAKT